MMRGTGSPSHRSSCGSAPGRLYTEAKRVAHVELSELDFRQDRTDWEVLSSEYRVPLLAYLALFETGTRCDFSQSSRLVPLIIDRHEVDELQCFTTLLAEKARFHDLFGVVSDEVTGRVGSPNRFFGESYRHFMFDWLESTVDTALDRRDGKSLIEAFFAISAVTEGVLARSGYIIFARTLDRLGMMPTLRAQLRRQFERTSDHVEFGYHIIEQFLRSDPSNNDVISPLIDSAFDPSLSTIRELFAKYATPVVPQVEALAITLEQLSDVDARLHAILNPPTPHRTTDDVSTLTAS
ncbi:MAG: hypothetical protein ACQEVA_11060 [Myxococcota bacterium]